MERTFIKDLRGKIDQTVKLQGWLQTLRDQKKIQFLILRDPTGLVQVAHWKPNDEVLAEKIAALGAETALTITGKVIDNPIKIVRFIIHVCPVQNGVLPNDRGTKVDAFSRELWAVPEVIQ